jgi:hypothetical protein
MTIEMKLNSGIISVPSAFGSCRFTLPGLFPQDVSLIKHLLCTVGESNPRRSVAPQHPLDAILAQL